MNDCLGAMMFRFFAWQTHHILCICHLCQPHDSYAIERSGDRYVSHCRRWRRAMPMFVTGWANDHIASPDLNDRTAFALGPAAAGSYYKCLSQRVRMPGRARARLKSDIFKFLPIS